ncbi:MAG TPA: rhodanese-like domain-containing protein, partial [Dehalococcoidia bacterium]|nr:rhodanese-like domain-containing protein [Dehalococcoidia bacterium]
PLATGPAERRVPGLDEARAQAKTVSPAELSPRLQAADAPIVLDVRGSGDYAMGHLPGARWLSRGYLELRIGELAPDKGRPIVLVDGDTIRVYLAAATLRDLGYGDVAVLEGGFPAWQAAGLPIEEGLADAPATIEEAKGDVDPFFRRGILARTREDMIRYLEWEEELGRKYETAQHHQG